MSWARLPASHREKSDQERNGPSVTVLRVKRPLRADLVNCHQPKQGHRSDAESARYGQIAEHVDKLSSDIGQRAGGRLIG